MASCFPFPIQKTIREEHNVQVRTTQLAVDQNVKGATTEPPSDPAALSTCTLRNHLDERLAATRKLREENPDMKVGEMFIPPKVFPTVNVWDPAPAETLPPKHQVPPGNFQLPQNPKGGKAQPNLYSDMTRYKEHLVKYPAVMR
mmetsp:Transcript_29048/g.74601  ORF Transcript_29048/g.74601 Transcript_29048/m.74601 type:complete len:144 (-) Transcript_29048:456-887(-)